MWRCLQPMHPLRDFLWLRRSMRLPRSLSAGFLGIVAFCRGRRGAMSCAGLLRKKEGGGKYAYLSFPSGGRIEEEGMGGITLGIFLPQGFWKG